MKLLTMQRGVGMSFIDEPNDDDVPAINNHKNLGIRMQKTVDANLLPFVYNTKSAVVTYGTLLIFFPNADKLVCHFTQEARATSLDDVEEYLSKHQTMKSKIIKADPLRKNREISQNAYICRLLGGIDNHTGLSYLMTQRRDRFLATGKGRLHIW